VRRAEVADIPELARLREALWPDSGAASHQAELEQALDHPDEVTVIFMVRASSGDAAGFAEAALRHDYVNGCETSPVTFLEGIYVEPTHRREGVARRLVEAVEHWGAERGCREFASDAILDNEVSHRMHAALGFEETERVVFFRKPLTKLDGVRPGTDEGISG